MRQASRRFGNLTQLREQSRDFRLSATLETTFQDLRYALRGMRKSPAFAITAILSLALAIGANTAIYSIVDAALLRPLPVPEPDRLFTLATPGIQEPGRAEPPGERTAFNYPLYQQFPRRRRETPPDSLCSVTSVTRRSSYRFPTPLRRLKKPLANSSPAKPSTSCKSLRHWAAFLPAKRIAFPGAIPWR